MRGRREGSRHGARPMEEAWVIAIRNQCQRLKIPFFFKQWGGVQKSKAGRKLQEATYDEMPAFRPDVPRMTKAEREQLMVEVSTLAQRASEVHSIS